jgi:hypothetical protein
MGCFVGIRNLVNDILLQTKKHIIEWNKENRN